MTHTASRHVVIPLLLAAALLVRGPSVIAQADLEIVEHVIPTPGSMPHSIAAAPDGRIFGNSRVGRIGR